MADIRWQVQQVKQRLSEVLRAAETDGPQFVTRHGKDVAVVLSIDDYRTREEAPPKHRTLTEWVLNGPTLDLPDDEIDALFARDRRTSARELPFSGPEWE